MSINLGNLELTLIQKIDSSTSPLEIQTYSKALEYLRNNMINKVPTFSSLPNYSDNIGTLYYVVDEDTVYWANASSGWITLQTQSISGLYIWGNPIGGKLLNLSTSIASSSPRQEYTSQTNWCVVADNYVSGHAVKCDGTLWSWGCNNAGQLGINRPAYTVCSTYVQEITSSINWTFVDGSASAAVLGLKSNGEFWAWGEGQYGALGVGNIINHSSPVQEISSSTNWSIISAGRYISAGIKTDGTLWTWGRNHCGQLATNNLTSYSSPVQEITSSTWIDVAPHEVSIYAIKTNGTLWNTGCGFCGALATNNTTNYSSPVQEVSSSTNWCKVSNKSGIKTDGTLWAWGFNITGQLGTNNTICYSSPVQEVTSSTNWCFIKKNSVNSIGIKTDGTLWGWGTNTCGSLGDETTITRSSPVQEISSSSNWCFADTESNFYHTTFAIKYIAF